MTLTNPSTTQDSATLKNLQTTVCSYTEIETDAGKLLRALMILVEGLEGQTPAPVTPTPVAAAAAPPLEQKIKKAVRKNHGTGLFAVVSAGVRSAGINGITEEELFTYLQNSGQIGNGTELKHIVSQLKKGSSVFVKHANGRWIFRTLLRKASPPPAVI